jgi:hypothetical protein
VVAVKQMPRREEGLGDLPDMAKSTRNDADADDGRYQLDRFVACPCRKSDPVALKGVTHTADTGRAL